MNRNGSDSLLRALNKDPKGYYAALGLDPSADSDQIKAAFRERAKQVHPDYNSGPEAEAAFQRISEAYRVLRDPLSRLDYASFGDGGLPADTIRLQPCSRCGKISAQPRFLVFHQVRCVLFSVRNATLSGIFCPVCAGRTGLAASALTWAQGWWGPAGLVLAPLALLRNLRGGTRPKNQNFTLLLNQARAFAASGRADVARGVLAQAGAFVQTPADADSLAALVEALGRSPRRLKNQWKPLNRAFLLQLLPLAGLLGVLAALGLMAIRLWAWAG